MEEERMPLDMLQCSRQLRRPLTTSSPFKLSTISKLSVSLAKTLKASSPIVNFAILILVEYAPMSSATSQCQAAEFIWAEPQPLVTLLNTCETAWKSTKIAILFNVQGF
jgi:hypothetical protein